MCNRLALLRYLFAGCNWSNSLSNSLSLSSACAKRRDVVASTQSQLASTQLSADRLSLYSDLAVAWLQEYLRIDTTNPPGNELQAAHFFKKILDREGIENRVYEYQPGRANLRARIPHTTGEAKRPIILLNHMDVVSSDAAHWKVPPFSGQMLDGSIMAAGRRT